MQSVRKIKWLSILDNKKYTHIQSWYPKVQNLTAWLSLNKIPFYPSNTQVKSNISYNNISYISLHQVYSHNYLSSVIYLNHNCSTFLTITKLQLNYKVANKGRLRLASNRRYINLTFKSAMVCRYLLLTEWASLEAFSAPSIPLRFDPDAVWLLRECVAMSKRREKNIYLKIHTKCEIVSQVKNKFNWISIDQSRATTQLRPIKLLVINKYQTVPSLDVLKQIK